MMGMDADLFLLYLKIAGMVVLKSNIICYQTHYFETMFILTHLNEK